MLDFAEAARVEADAHECGRKRQVARQAILDDLAVTRHQTPIRRQIATAFAERTQDIDLEPITIP